MPELKLQILNKTGQVQAEVTAETLVTLVYTAAYQEGDVLCLSLEQGSAYVEMQLDDALKPAVIYSEGTQVCYTIPFGEKRSAITPKAFCGEIHVLFARVVPEDEAKRRRNLALNPYDGFLSAGVYPHASANVETRDEAVFAARNAVDGIFANNSHGNFPYGSWGINRQADAEWTLAFGREVLLDEVRITIRADFPHDSYWTQATLEFGDGNIEILHLAKTAQPQVFCFSPRRVKGLVLKKLIKADDPSPFPALTQFEAFGSYV